jgi:putative ABC transport system permease protein
MLASKCGSTSERASDLAQNISLAFRQLTYDRMKFATAISGVMVAVMLMWIQLGILAAVYESTTVIHRHITADLVVFHPLSENMNGLKPFSVRTLYRVRGYPDVTGIGELLIGVVEWRRPDNGTIWKMQTYGIEVEEGWVDLPGLMTDGQSLREADTFLFDRNSRAVFGPVVQTFLDGKPFEVELNHRRARVVGLTSMAASFGQQGNIVTSRANYLRLLKQFSPDEVHLGFVRLRSGADVPKAQAYLRQILSPEAVVMTPQEFTDYELLYLKQNAPVGFVFTMGAVAGFFIGFIVVYQILYTDVTNNLPNFATMKAIGFTDGALFRIVIRQGIILSVLGYIPGSILAIGFYQIIQAGTSIPVRPTWDRAWLLLGLTCLMCLLSGAMATRKLRAADPADVF